MVMLPAPLVDNVAAEPFKFKVPAPDRFRSLPAAGCNKIEPEALLIVAELAAPGPLIVRLPVEPTVIADAPEPTILELLPKLIVFAVTPSGSPPLTVCVLPAARPMLAPASATDVDALKVLDPLKVKAAFAFKLMAPVLDCRAEAPFMVTAPPAPVD